MRLLRQGLGAGIALVGLALLAFPDAGQAVIRPDGPESLEIRTALARVDSLLAAAALPQALEAAQRLHARHAADPYRGWQVESRLGVALLRSGQPEAALAPLENAIRLNPAPAENHRNLGTALIQLGRRGRALAEYAQAVELAPDDPDIRLEYGQLLLDFRDGERAKEHILAADRLCGGCPETQEPLARLYLATGEFDLAAGVIRKLLVNRPSPVLRRSLIQALQGAGRDSTLLDFLERGQLQDLPADEAMLLVELEGKLGRPHRSEAFALALADPDRAATRIPASVLGLERFWGVVSYNLLLAGKDRAALTAVGRAVSLAPDNVVYRNNRVVLLTRLGMHEEAAREWERVLALDPSLKERTKK